jgi:amino acid adenylation domain-containing protein
MSSNADKIAVVGMACRFPGAGNLNEFWDILIEGRDTVKHFTDEELEEFEYDFENLRKNPYYVKAKGILNDIDKFDAAFFGYLPKEAEELDPQYRVWLETVWSALENAGCDPFSYKGKIGVYAGGSINSYLLNNVLRGQRKMENYIRMRSADSFQTMIANEVSGLPTKTAYKLDLKGPAINVQTACSTSLVAVSLGCQSLLMNETDMCIAGGVTISVPQETGYIHQEGAISSPDGCCRSFDAEAKGTVFSNGVGVVVLKRLEDAIRDKDVIYSVVTGWALNNDGKGKVSYVAPSIDGQSEVIQMAQAFADVSPEDIGYIEAHGTATQLGDPIELTALTNAFSLKTDKKQFCGIGSVKSNIGHTDVVAGIAGFIKASLCIVNKTIPPTIHYTKPNPFFNFEDSPFYVQDKLKKWDGNKPLIIGVSSFGIGGTNVHVILEEPPVPQEPDTSTSEWPELVLLSAKSPNSLVRRKQDLSDFLKANPDLNIRDIAYSLKIGRNHMKYRSFMVASETKEMISPTSKFTDGKTDDFISKIAFMFPGQGAQYLSMGHDLYQSNTLFRQILDECFEIMKSETGEDLKKLLFQSSDKAEADKKLASTDITQPALFIIEYALAKVFIRLDIKPAYLIGHSIGEYTAACIAGVFDLPTALRIVLKRARLMKGMNPGEMMAVRTSKEKIESIKEDFFEIAADNADDLCSISIKPENLAKVKKLLDEKGIQFIPLNTSHAFHSADFDPILNEFSNYVNQFTLNVPKLPFISCLTGEFITDEQAVSGSYWAKQLRNSVLFRKGISTIKEIEDVVFLEVGPNTHLSSLVRQNEKVVNKKAIIATLGKSDKVNEQYKVIAALGNIFNTGIDIDFEILQNNFDGVKISLPTYSFEKTRCWIDFKLSDIADNQEYKDTAEKLTILSSDEKISADGQILLMSPQEKTSGIILKIWKGLFGIDEINPDDNFFDIGGHSLLALQILNRIKEELHQNISLKTFLDNPTINGLCSIIDKVKGPVEAETEIVHLTDLSHLALSDNQKRLWIIYKLDSSNPAYNIPFTYHLKGDFNLEVFKKSISVLFNRHHIVFSLFKQEDGIPYSEIVPKPVHIEFIDFSGSGFETAKEEIYSFIGEDSRKSFNIETGPLYRLFLLKLDDTNYYFHSTINHIIFDGWSWGVFIRDFNKIYNNLIIGADPQLEELPYQYYDYAEWKKSTANKLNEEDLAKFWVNYLKGCPPVLNFPFDHLRINTPTGLGGKEYIQIPADCSAKLKAISKNDNSTLFSTLLSVFGILLHKYSGSNDFCLGTPVANRPQSKLEDVFGMFINTIAIRIVIDTEGSFNTLVSSVRNSAIDAISHQELPFEKIVEAVNPARSFNLNPLFQVCFAWQNNLSIPMDLRGLRGERITVGEGISPFDLTFYMWENGDFIEGEIEYSSALLNPETILRLKNNLLNLINDLVENPDTAIGSLALISDEEKTIINGFSDTRTDYPRDKTIVQVFEEQVSAYGDKTAIVFKAESLTYKQLNEKANQLARTLRESGIRENTPVGILAEKSLEMVLGTLAILKSGGAYVPIDPEYPEQRLNFIIRDSGCKVLITQEKFMKVAIEGVTKINMNSPASYNKDKSNVGVINGSSDLAYIMYTSGTTGIPKGSMITQKGVVRLVKNTDYLDWTSDERILLTGAIVFDAITFEMWGALLNGGTLYIAEKETILNPKALGEELYKNEITLLFLTSALLTQIAEARTDIFGKLKYLVSGGDVLSAPHINKIRRDNPNLKVINGYGPTENTTFSTTYLIERDFSYNIPIGKPMSNSTAYIFDRNMNYQPIGVVGELYVGGDGVSIGYINRDDLNKKSFMAHPDIPGERLYKTGDYARWLPDGNIEFHGRMDNQLKLRGFRVELGEIESVISEIDGIIETVIKPLKVEEGDIRLVAFMNVSEGFNMDTKDLANRIKEKLPPYMVPSAFKFMNGFPKTINGKTDRDALISDINDVVIRESQDLKTFTQNEMIIYKIWSEALKTKDISTTDNFFDIGGNSLLAISVFAKIESAFKVELGLRIFFDSPRIKDLAEAIHFSRIKDVKQKSSKKSNEEGARIIEGEI